MRVVEGVWKKKRGGLKEDTTAKRQSDPTNTGWLCKGRKRPKESIKNPGEAKLTSE